MTPALASPCPRKVHTIAPRCFPYFREMDASGSVVASYLCFDCGRGFAVKWPGPVTGDQARHKADAA